MYGRGSHRSREYAMEDITFSLAAADVVIVDDMNITSAEWWPIVDAVQLQFEENGWDGKMCMVQFTCRDEAHALELNNRTWRPISDDDWDLNPQSLLGR
ncbi:hypothetical protein PHYPSEUDO_010947 [Phytophthora pseudosyringae]|uniref:Uncharacterized protein n=1 Tax=Phytophthora pseudosyringae TaxID=221518 RepID=A0A8T1VCJ1_9STRA|nr:hypothetical protein PHYPSEUDO_010946 [Phytophthora pseudosyringae]KAG7377809.1 hypothetical protein PHYPSEUDO_010947 [Phytophthora pseudosyringae]